MSDHKDPKKELSVTDAHVSKTSQWTRVLGGALVLLLIIGIGLGFYMVCAKTHQLVHQVKNVAHQFQQQQLASSERIQIFSKQLSQLRQQVKNTQKQLTKIRANRQDSREEWLLLQARDYLILAGVNVYLTDSYSPVLTLLTQADSCLAQIDSPEIVPVRQAIAKEKAMIMALATVDIVGEVSKIQALEDKIKTLPVKSPILNNQSSTSSWPKDKTVTHWQAHLKDSVSLLEKLVVVRRTDLDAEPLLSNSQEMLIRERIRFYLEMSQWAILHAQQQVYQTSLQQVKSALTQYFDEQDPASKAFINAVSTLETLHLNIEKPKLGQALELLNQVLNKSKQPGVTGG